MTVDPKRLAAAAAQWAVTHRVMAGGWNLRYREAGAGPPLVLVHGLGCSTDYWVRNGAWIAAAGFRVLAPDLPGFGRTDGPRAGLSIVQQAYAVSVFAGAMQLGPAAYLGHSLSCQTVLELACTEPERVSALILAAPTGDRRKKRLLREVIGFLRDIPREPPSLVPIILDAYLRAGPFRWARTWLAGKRHDAFDAARGVQAPAMVMVGERDPVVPVHFASAIAETIGHAKLHIIPHGAHALIYDEPEGFNRAVVEFLEEVRRGDGAAGGGGGSGRGVARSSPDRVRLRARHLQERMNPPLERHEVRLSRTVPSASRRLDTIPGSAGRFLGRAQVCREGHMSARRSPGMTAASNPEQLPLSG